MSHKLGKLFFEKYFENLLINENTQHAAVIVNGQNGFGGLSENPEGLFFIQVLEQVANDEIHALAISDFVISFHERRKHIFQWYN